MSEDRAAPGKGASIGEKYPVGSRVQGRVVAVVDSGFLVEVEEGVRGLIAFSDRHWRSWS